MTDPPAMAGDLLFSVVIPVYNDPDRLALCLQALSAQSLDDALFEVIVIDNGSLVSPDAVVVGHRFARLLYEPAAGSYNARNTGCRVATGRHLAFTDSDCRPHPGWLAEALRHFDGHPEVAAIGGRIELDRNQPPSSAELYERVFAFQQQRYVHHLGFAATANLLVRRDAFERVGPFDGALKTGGDREWGQRLAMAGYRMDYVEAATVSHPARTRIRELIHKRRRFAGAAHVEVPTLSQLLPGQPERPYRQLPLRWQRWRAMLWAPKELGLSGLQGWRVLAVIVILDFVAACERLRLRISGEPVR